MSKFSKDKKLITDYINGNDIDIDVELLENDLDFMIAAIDYSNDQNLYKLCGEDIKYNFEMIKFLVEKFHDDSEFIIDTVIDFLDNYDYANWYKKYNETNPLNEKNVEELEVLITIDEYLPKVLDERIMEIEFRLKDKYTKFRIFVEVALESGLENKLNQTIDKGFSLVEMLYPTSYLIKDYYAKSIIDEILIGCEGNTYEEKIHKLSDSLEQPENALKTLINIAKKYDVELSNYIIARSEAFEKYIHNIDLVINNWDNYNNRIIDERILDILDVISDYYHKYGHLLDMEEFETIKYFASLLELEERFKALDPTCFECESLNDELKGNTYHDRKMLRELTPIIKNIIQGENKYEATGDVQDKESNKSNIAQFRPKR